MNKENLIQLTNKIYQMTLLFPKKEPLRYKIRETADEVLVNFISWHVLRDFNPGSFAADWEKQYKNSIFLLERNLEIIKNYFEIVKWQNWVSYFDVLEIQEKYDKIQSDFKEEIEDFKPSATFSQKTAPEKEEKPKEDPVSSNVSVIGKGRELDSRKEKILEFLKKKDKVQVQEIKEIFPDTSKRTIRRDFVQLLKQGLVEKIGEKNNTFYKLTD